MVASSLTQGFWGCPSAKRTSSSSPCGRLPSQRYLGKNEETEVDIDDDIPTLSIFGQVYGVENIPWEEKPVWLEDFKTAKLEKAQQMEVFCQKTANVLEAKPRFTVSDQKLIC